MARRVAALLAAVVTLTTACSTPSSSQARPAVGSVDLVGGAFGPGVFITSIWSDPWVAVGWTAGADGLPATACFLSPDARVWKPCGFVPVDTDGYHTRLLGVARVGSTLIAGGVAVGALHGNLRPYLFAGPLGGPLSELNLPRETFGGERIITFDGLAAGPLGVFAVGTWDGVTNQSVAQVWRTADGTDWKRLDGVASLTSTADEVFGGRAVAVGSHRVVVVGSTIDLKRLADGDDGAVWWSDDGSSWSRADLTGAHTGGPGNQELRTVAAVGATGFLTGGSSGDAAAVWSSVDGRQWRPTAVLPGGRGPGATITALAGGTTREWAAGVVDGSARLWSSADGRHWTTQPLPAAALGAAGAAQSVALAADAHGRLLVVVQGTRGSYGAEAVLGRA